MTKCTKCGGEVVRKTNVTQNSDCGKVTWECMECGYIQASTEPSEELVKEMEEAIQEPWGEILKSFEKLGMSVTLENESFFKMGFVAAYMLLKDQEHD